MRLPLQGIFGAYYCHLSFGAFPPVGERVEFWVSDVFCAFVCNNTLGVVGASAVWRFWGGSCSIVFSYLVVSLRLGCSEDALFGLLMTGPPRACFSLSARGSFATRGYD